MWEKKNSMFLYFMVYLRPFYFSNFLFFFLGILCLFMLFDRSVYSGAGTNLKVGGTCPDFFVVALYDLIHLYPRKPV